jgi:lipopolysaccharide/colanic/teichoic acid biosynthesis glycosyltransferase
MSSELSLASMDAVFDQAQEQNNERFYLFCKRAMDLVVAGLAIVLLLPVFAIVALLIKATSRGPVFFVQTRAGKFGKPFKCYKFRSMVRDAEAKRASVAALNHHADPRTFKVQRDPRITRIGEFLRKTSIDEMPQLLNVLRGEMSIVGPRPPIPSEVQRYEPHELRRLEVTPGLTCIWQVCGRGDIPFPEQCNMDIRYIETRNLRLDMKLILLTIPAVVFGRGAY